MFFHCHALEPSRNARHAQMLVAPQTRLRRELHRSRVVPIYLATCSEMHLRWVLGELLALRIRPVSAVGGGQAAEMACFSGLQFQGSSSCSLEAG
jgi:hypothetical protein